MKLLLINSSICLFLLFAGDNYLFSFQQVTYSHPERQQNYFKWNVLSESKIDDSPAFSSIFFFDKNNGITATPSTIEKTVDGGKTWFEQRLYKGKSFSKFVFVDKQTGWIVGAEDYKPLVMKSADKGVIWQKINFDAKLIAEDKRFTYFSDICFLPSGQVWIAGDGGIIKAAVKEDKLKTLDIFSTQEQVLSVSCNNSGEAWAAGAEGTIFHYQNGWSKKEINKNYVFKKIISNKSDIWVLGGESVRDENAVARFTRMGILLRSQNNGESWENKTPESAELLSDLFFTDNTGWLVGNSGGIYYSKDKGDSWIKSISPTTSNLSHIFFRDSKNIWISGAGETVLKFQN